MNICEFVCGCEYVSVYVFAYASVLFCLFLHCFKRKEEHEIWWEGGGPGRSWGREKNMNKIYCKNLKRELTICYCCFPLVILRLSLDIVLTIWHQISTTLVNL